jgi:catechol 2,3-dioxygenase-like lactoylglutathione lyase family enzyme
MLHHVALGARDVDGVAAFYRRAFDAPAVLVAGIGAGPFLLAFPVDTSERVAREARLLELGAAIESRTEHTSYARDPEGNRVALSAYPLGRGTT